jgi:hypothetical protein
MTELGTGDAARELAEIEKRQAAALRRVLVPAWYWWAVGAGMIALGAVVDTQATGVVVAGALVFAVLVAALSVWAIAGGMTGARARSELLGPEGAAGIVLLDLLVVGAAISVALVLRQLGWPYPAVAGTAAGALLLVAGGPFLMARLERSMRARAAR